MNYITALSLIFETSIASVTDWLQKKKPRRVSSFKLSCEASSVSETIPFLVDHLNPPIFDGANVMPIR
jgi:hypothetical protein